MSSSNVRVTLVIGAGARVDAALLAIALDGAHCTFPTIDAHGAESADDAENADDADDADDAQPIDEDAVVQAIVRERGRGARDIIIDGFPRTTVEAERFDAALVRAGLCVDRVVEAEVSDTAIVRECALRRVCAACGARYHLKHVPPRVVDTCDRCGERGLVERACDRDVNVARALAQQRAWAAELRERYAAARSEDGTAPVDAPLAILERALADMETQLVEAKEQTAIAIADEKRLQKQRESERALGEEWQKKAALAVRAGSDELAKQALIRARDHEELAAGYDVAWQQQRVAVDQLKRALQSLHQRLMEARRKRTLLGAQARRAGAGRTIAAALGAPGAVFDEAAAALEARHDGAEEPVN